MHQWATFADLPVELSERIILLAARSCAFEKAWLTHLTRASRAIHTLVQPILVHTIVITSSNLSRLCAAPGAFTSTRCLMVDDDVEDDQLLRAFLLSASELHSVETFRGPMWVLDALLKVSRPSRVIITPALWRGGRWNSSAEDIRAGLSQTTHIRGALPAVYSLLSVPDLSRCTTHVFIDRFLGRGSLTQNLPILLETLIAPLLVPRLHRLCIAVEQAQSEWTSRLSSFAHEHRETRLWINSVQPEIDPYTAFDDERWTAGQQLYCGD